MKFFCHLYSVVNVIAHICMFSLFYSYLYDFFLLNFACSLSLLLLIVMNGMLLLKYILVMTALVYGL